MQNHLVFTVIAKDKPGLVEVLADTIAAKGGNWVDSSMSRLGGEFAGIVRVAVDEAATTALQTALTDLARDGIDITLRTGDEMAEAVAGASAHLDVVSQDHPGILRDITQVLSAHGVSIEYLETSVVSGSMQGEALFRASADLRLPDGLLPTSLSEALQETAGDLMADISLLE